MMLSTLPTSDEHDISYLRGLGAGCVRRKDTHPTHPTVVAPACKNGLAITNADEGEAVNALLCVP